MKTLAWLAIFVASALLAYLAMHKLANIEQNIPMQQEQVTVIPIEHASGILAWGASHIYFDPTGSAEQYANQPAANIILLTDIHGDHFSTSTIAALIGSATLIAPQAVKEQLPEELAARVQVLANGESMTEQGFSITAVPMYNLPGENERFHTKGRGNGYLIEKSGVRVYIAGDTAGIPEMRALTNINIALIPMNLPYTMSVEEAADAVLAFKPNVVYPYHYRTPPKGFSDVNRFKELVNAGDSSIEVVLAEWYPGIRE